MMPSFQNADYIMASAMASNIVGGWLITMKLYMPHYMWFYQ